METAWDRVFLPCFPALAPAIDRLTSTVIIAPDADRGNPEADPSATPGERPPARLCPQHRLSPQTQSTK